MATTSHRGKRVLIVEDDPHIRRGLERLLRQVGYGVEATGDSAAAFDSIARVKPDVILSDVYRGGGTGIDFVRALRARRETEALPVVLLTGNPTVADAAEALQLGVFRYLVKPATVEEIVGALEQALGFQVDPVLSLIDFGAELRDLDFKERLELKTKRACAELARDLIGMANSGGGTIVVGVGQRDGVFVALGLSSPELEALDVTKLADAVRAYASQLSFSARVVQREQLRLVAISVKPAQGTIVLALKSNQEAGLFTGRIYVRGDDARTAELQSPVQLQELLERVISQRTRQLRELT
jgi:CheY-like chemotaxis protein